MFSYCTAGPGRETPYQCRRPEHPGNGPGRGPVPR